MSRAEELIADLEAEIVRRDARIEELEAHCVRLGQGDAERYWEGRWRDADEELAALKAQPGGAVLPEPFEMRPFQTVDQGSTNYKAGFNAAIRKVRESLNSLPASASSYQDDPRTPQELGLAGCKCVRYGDGNPYWPCAIHSDVSAGVVDEQAFDTEKGAVLFCEARGIDDESPYRDRALDAFVSGAAWQARADRPDHSAQTLNMVQDGWTLVPIFPDIRMYGEMVGYGCAAGGYGWDEFVRDYTDMLAVAPAPGKQEGGE